MNPARPTTLDTLAGHVQRTAKLGDDVAVFLIRQGLEKLASHSKAVARQAEQLADRVGLDPRQAAAAGWLHDVGLVWPRSERVAAAAALGIPVLPEERIVPGILHQKFSAHLARELFGITDSDILSAVSCHSTLRSGASLLDKCVFVADKLTWDPQAAPFLGEMTAALDRSLAAAVLVYLDFMWQQRPALPVLHPWLAAAYHELNPPTDAGGI